MKNNSKIYIAGHRGLVGSAIVRKLSGEGFSNIITQTHSELDLTRQADGTYPDNQIEQSNPAQTPDLLTHQKKVLGLPN